MTNNKSQKRGKKNMNKDVHEPVTKCDQSKEVVTNCDNNQFVVANSLQSVDVESLIRNIRGQQVMLDSDLAMLYGVETRRLNEQVKRNIERFPDDFMFQLTRDDLKTVCNTARFHLDIAICDIQLCKNGIKKSTLCIYS